MEVGHRRFYDSLLRPQVVGDLLYYRFLNPAVVAPDAFDIVAMAAGGALAAPQRHALGAVAQVLQHAAAGKAFSRESQHLRVSAPSGITFMAASSIMRSFLGEVPVDSMSNTTRGLSSFRGSI